MDIMLIEFAQQLCSVPHFIDLPGTFSPDKRSSFSPKTEFQSNNSQLTIDSVLMAVMGADPPLWEPLYTGGVYHLFVESTGFFFFNDLLNYLLFHSFITCL